MGVGEISPISKNRKSAYGRNFCFEAFLIRKVLLAIERKTLRLQDYHLYCNVEKCYNLDCIILTCKGMAGRGGRTYENFLQQIIQAPYRQKYEEERAM